MKRDMNTEVYKHFIRQQIHQSKVTYPMHLSSTELLVMEKPQESSKKRKKSKNEYYDQFKPMFIILQLCGRSALQFKNGEFVWKWMSWQMLFCFVTYSLQTFTAILACKKRTSSVIENQGHYDEFIFAIHILAYLQIHFHVPFTFWAQGSKLAEYLNNWMEFQDDWAVVCGPEKFLSLKKVVRCFTIISIPCVVLLIVFEQYSTLHDPWHYLLPYLFTIESTMLVLGLWYCTCVEIERLGKTMTSCLIQNLECRPNVLFIQKWRSLWISLCCLTSSLGTHLAAVIMSIVFTFGATFLLGLYNALSQVMKLDFSWKALGYLCASILSLTIIYLLCDAGHRPSTQIGSNAVQNILQARIASSNQNIRYELDLLLTAVKCDPEIKLSGFVTLNRPLFISFVSNTLTYLIVILQFKFN